MQLELELLLTPPSPRPLNRPPRAAMAGLLKLATLVQYVPLPVIGGYLAFVGYFCLAAGVSLASGVAITADPVSWLGLLHVDPLIKLAPALVLLAGLNFVQRRFQNPLALPVLLALTPVVFFAIVYLAGSDIHAMRDAGWVTKPQAGLVGPHGAGCCPNWAWRGPGDCSLPAWPAQTHSYLICKPPPPSPLQPGEGAWEFWKAWKMLGIDSFPPRNVHWGLVPRQAGKILALYFVVAFGSSMDIAAIQADVERPLDYNRELVTVGLSNVVTGLTGVGYTGSYIFSQTLFNLRQGVDSWTMGAVVTGELAAGRTAGGGPARTRGGFCVGWMPRANLLTKSPHPRLCSHACPTMT